MSAANIPVNNRIHIIRHGSVPTKALEVADDGRLVFGRTDRRNAKQQWRFVSSGLDWKIVNVSNGKTIGSNTENRQLSTLSDDDAAWSLEINGANAVLVSSQDKGFAISYRNESELQLGSKDNADLSRSFVIEVLPSNPDILPRTTSFEERFFRLDPEEAQNETYDLIIVGTGIGGGVLAHDLFDTNTKIGKSAKKILVIERGHLIFHSHCLNAARPSGLGEDRGQQNDTFFEAFKGDYNGALESAGKGNWKGGPLYGLGGRSSVWGLFAPRVHDDTLKHYFHEDIYRELIGEYYEKAEYLMNLSLPNTKPDHQHLIDRLNVQADNKRQVQWQWGRIASEFSDTRNFDFAEGAYSSIDKLLEVAMSKPKKDGEEVEHEDFKILLGVNVRNIEWKEDNKKTAEGVSGVTSDGRQVTYKLNPKGRVILAAGSVDSPAILLRSGVDIQAMNGGHITDHDIYFKDSSFRYDTLIDRQKVGAMKLQTYVRAGEDDDVVLANMSLDASTFLPRSKNRYDDLPKFIMVFILRNPLVPKNDIVLDDEKEPKITITRTAHDAGEARNKKLKDLQTLTASSMRAIQDVLRLKFLNMDTDNTDPNKYFKKLELGGVAHELGSLPMVAPHLDKASLDKDLKLIGYEGLYVCDLSIFPYSPEANPTLTLAALAIRLSRHLSPRKTVKEGLDKTDVNVVNHSGKPIYVFVSNQADFPNPGPRPSPLASTENDWVELLEGEAKTWPRMNPGDKGPDQTRKIVYESVSVRRLNPFWDGKNPEPDAKYWSIPEVYIGSTDKVLSVHVHMT